ncbi:RNA polymerase sigma factor [Alicyclobacillus sp. SO9]|uniref:RNA polymerase sigma factor n=1 Tax=Alicyclobacillus sp. SO9 TaxID=2665646 RepID=UPI0018E75D76|nr:RNA polymerase sigma factor [Alicyclobacillus sp. SO9]QQE78559.1 RNA polymerase sigma factor [Alicyclobacillus sp. SO9]
MSVDVSSLESWYRNYADDVYTFLAYFLTNHDVDDLVQETFARGLRGIRTYDGAASPKTWLMRIAHNVAIDHVRRHHPALLSDDLIESMAGTEPDVSETVIGRDEAEQMLTYLASIKRAYRQVVVLRTILDYSIRDTAAVLGWSESKVSVTYHRALKALRHRLQRTEVRYGDEEDEEKVY